MTQQFQLLFAFVLGDFFAPFLFQVAHFKASSIFDYTTMRTLKIALFIQKVKVIKKILPTFFSREKKVGKEKRECRALPMV